MSLYCQAQRDAFISSLMGFTCGLLFGKLRKYRVNFFIFSGG